MAKFRNPSNGYTQGVNQLTSFLGCLLFGVLYFAYKGVWKHAAISFFAALMTCGLAWLIYPFFAYQCVKTSYLERGWQEVGKRPNRTPATRRQPGPSFDGINV